MVTIKLIDGTKRNAQERIEYIRQLITTGKNYITITRVKINPNDEDKVYYIMKNQIIEFYETI